MNVPNGQVLDDGRPSSDVRSQTEFFPFRAAQIGITMFIATVVMLFAAFTSAYLIRRDMAGWQSIEMPGILWLNTALLLLSSLSFERGYHAMRGDNSRQFFRFLTLTVILGGGFLAGQIVAWKELSAQGIFLSSNPHSAFFYILSGLHGLHLIGGLVFLTYLATRFFQHPERARMVNVVQAARMYWHFLGLMWLFLFFVLFVL